MPKRRFFYGWLIVFAVLLGELGAGMMAQFGLTVFVRPMSESLGWSRAVVASGISFRLVFGAIVALFVGRLIDRRGVRWIMLTAGLVGVTAVLLISRVTAPWQFLLLFGIAGGATAAGAGEFMTGSVVPKWFVRKRGIALGIATMGGVLVGVVFAPIMAVLVSRQGWRAGWLFVAAIMALTIIPASFVMRRRPEDLGLRPDGDPPTNALPRASAPRRAVSADAEESWTPREAVRTPVFWLMLLAFNLSGFSIVGVVVHELSYLFDRGYAPGVAATVVSVHASSGVVARFVWGYLVDKLPVRYCLAIIYSGAGFATLVLLNARVLPLAFAFGVTFGLCIGGNSMLNAMAWSNYFGRSLIGSIRAIVVPFQVVAMATGPVFSGVLYEATGNYAVPLGIFTGTFVAAGLLFTVLRAPTKRTSTVAKVAAD